MVFWRRPLAWTRTLLAIAALALGAPLAIAAVVGVGALSPRSAPSGYLLYPRLGLCAPRLASAAQATISSVRSPFRPMRTADAVMPPGLGQTLTPEWLGARPASHRVLSANTFGE